MTASNEQPATPGKDGDPRSAWQAAHGPETIAVEPQRLAPAKWCHEKEKKIGVGDIYAAYSADLIGKGRIRKPFLLGQWRRVATSVRRRADTHVETYRLVPLDSYEGMAMSYREKLVRSGGDDARDDPLGFYHGMQVAHGGQVYVLVGPPVTIVPGEPAPVQSELF